MATTTDASSTAARTSVTISRTHSDDVGQRQIYARLDGGPQHMLLFGDRVTADVAPGDHVLKANNTLYWKTVRFSVREGEHAEFVVVNKAGRLAFGVLALFGAGPLALHIERR